MITKGNSSDADCYPGAQMVVLNNCRIEAMLTVDARGQMVLPKEFRQKAGIKAGDKLGLIALDKGDQFCCFMLIKANELAGQVKNIVGPIVAGPATVVVKRVVRKEKEHGKGSD